MMMDSHHSPPYEAPAPATGRISDDFDAWKDKPLPIESVSLPRRKRTQYLRQARACKACGQQYTPTGNAQMFCQACRDKLKGIQPGIPSDLLQVAPVPETTPVPGQDPEPLPEPARDPFHGFAPHPAGIAAPKPNVLKQITRIPCDHCGHLFTETGLLQHLPRCGQNPDANEPPEGMRLYTVHLPDGIVKVLDRVVQQAILPNRSEIIRVAVLVGLKTMGFWE